eukprot:gb/GECG01016158.1/.p1 GENE.gb/GECG01016158.1/~~gb/GECG01016158.1/.p1  ORF type:complete len:191 (+),score=2.13 gb/GECG01016158.1/:1-573(+)
MIMKRELIFNKVHPMHVPSDASVSSAVPMLRTFRVFIETVSSSLLDLVTSHILIVPVFSGGGTPNSQPDPLLCANKLIFEKVPAHDATSAKVLGTRPAVCSLSKLQSHSRTNPSRPWVNSTPPEYWMEMIPLECPFHCTSNFALSPFQTKIVPSPALSTAYTRQHDYVETRLHTIYSPGKKYYRGIWSLF